jgi:hypothetical protein
VTDSEKLKNKPRKIIQIAHAMSDERGFSIVALCDDGTLWDFDGQYRNWRQIPAIPQESAE